MTHLGRREVLPIGELLPEIVRKWTANVDGNQSVVLTGKQRAHYIERHPETAHVEELLRDAVLDPDQVHRNKLDPMMAIFYRRLDQDHYVRVAVLMQAEPGEKKHSILSYRLAGAKEVTRHAARAAWRR